MNTEQKTQKDLDFSVDIRKIIQKLLLYKYIFLLFFIISMSSAWYINAITVPIYTVKASLLIKIQESKGSSASVGQLLYGSEMLGSAKKLPNEIALMQSTPFIQTIISRMNMKVLYETQGRFYKTPIYKNIPLEVITCDTIKLPQYYKIEFINDSKIKLVDLTINNDEKLSVEYSIGDTIRLYDNSFVIKTTNYFNSATSKNTFFFELNTPMSLTNKYQGVLDIRQQSREASIVSISMNTNMPDRDIDFINKFMDEYVRYGLEDKTLEGNKTINFISKQLESITDSLLRVEGSLEAFKVKSKVSEAANPAEEFYTMLFAIEEQKNNLLLSDRYLTYLEDYIRKNPDIEREKLIVPSLIKMEGSSGGIENLITKLVELQIEKNTYLSGGASKNPALKDINYQISQLRNALLENINNLQANNKITIQNAEKRFADMEKQISKVPKSEREMVNIKRLFTLNENIYLLLLEKRLEAEIAKASATADAKIIEPAKSDWMPIAPKKRNNYIVAFLLGLIIPLVLVIAKEYLKNVLRNQEDLENISSIPIFGTIPQSSTKADPLTIIERPKSRLSESFRSLRSNIAFFTNSNSKNITFLFTSSISGEGKSFCSESFALVLASMNKKTLLMITDLRKPKFYIGSKDINEYEYGLSSFLIGSATTDQIIQKSQIDGLDFMPPGALPPNPAELLSRDVFINLLTELKEQYEYIIIDTAPIGLVSDSMAIIPYVDMVLYVVKQNYTPFSYITKIQEMYDNGKIKNIGFLLNGVKMFSNGYGYGYGYGYYEEEKTWWDKFTDRFRNK